MRAAGFGFGIKDYQICFIPLSHNLICMDRQSIRGAFSSRKGDFLDVMLVLIGVLLIGIGVLGASPIESLILMVGLLLGLFLIMTGVMRHYDWFPDKILSKNGLGTLLMCISPFLLVSSASLVFFADFDWAHSRLLPVEIGHGRIDPNWYIVEVPLVRIYVPLAALLMLVSIAVFLVGLLLKVLDNF
jgi:hypothetical protein